LVLQSGQDLSLSASSTPHFTQYIFFFGKLFEKSFPYLSKTFVWRKYNFRGVYNLILGRSLAFPSGEGGNRRLTDEESIFGTTHYLIELFN
jgi:hypothetical protein